MTDRERAGAAGSWRTARGWVDLGRPVVVGILNVTPDSFWDGGRYAGLDAALAAAEGMLGAGADAIDLGGESTRPGARAVAASEEMARILPVLRELVRRWPTVPITIDTVKAEVARAALEEGAAGINDVSGLRLDPAMAEVVAGAGAGLVIMHSRGPVERMARYEMAQYGPDPVGDVVAELAAARDRALEAGVHRDAIVLDPGLGFSKRTEHSVAMLAHLDRIIALGHPVLIGPSRKRFIGELGGGLPVDQRLEGTIAACVFGLLRGARLFRVHDVGAIRRALDVAESLRTTP
ncbi:MAG TPA: dihydropteroate synthase [Longimicrobiales bacterium]|nr:dihydropteroate synthase [Longimicrobiales bacterium]